MSAEIAQLFDFLIDAMDAHSEAEFALSRMVANGSISKDDAGSVEHLSALSAKGACQLRKLKYIVCSVEHKADG